MIRSNPDKNIVAVNFVYVPNKKVNTSIKIMLVFGDSKKSHSSSIYITPENWLNEEETSMVFVYPRVQSLIDFERKLHISLTVEKD